MKITLAKVLEALSHDTLSFMADSNSANGTIAADQIPKVISRVNSVLRRLAVKFVLSEKSVNVLVNTTRRQYSLKASDPWIVRETGVVFPDDVGQILGIRLPNGRMVALNESIKHDSIMLTPDAKSFIVATFLPSGTYKVIYKAITPQFDIRGTDQTAELDIPEALLNALYLGVSAITYEGIGGPENVQMAQAKWAQFEKECGEAKLNTAVETDDLEPGNRFRDRGFR
jgi:hypothetical protein